MGSMQRNVNLERKPHRMSYGDIIRMNKSFYMYDDFYDDSKFKAFGGGKKNKKKSKR